LLRNSHDPVDHLGSGFKASLNDSAAISTRWHRCRPHDIQQGRLNAQRQHRHPSSAKEASAISSPSP